MFKSALQYVNSLPFSITMKHYYLVHDKQINLKDNEINSPEAWDSLRESDPHFEISEKREEWLKASENLVKKDGQDGGLIKRSEDVVNILNRLGITSMFSVGSGGAGLEYQIKKQKPGLEVTCSEYSQVSVQRLRKVFIEANSVISFDILKGDWKTVVKDGDDQKQLVLMYRIDINFSHGELIDIFNKMHDSGVKNILVILCGVVTAKGVYNRLKQRAIWKIKREKPSFAGYLRTKQTFINIFSHYYLYEEVSCGGLPGFILKLK